VAQAALKALDAAAAAATARGTRTAHDILQVMDSVRRPTARVAPAPLCEAVAAALGQERLQLQAGPKPPAGDPEGGAVAGFLKAAGAELAGGVVLAVRSRRQLAHAASWRGSTGHGSRSLCTRAVA
jgi:hypothetical protein